MDRGRDFVRHRQPPHRDPTFEPRCINEAIGFELLDEVGGDEPRRHRVDTDTAGRPLAGHRLRHPAIPALAAP
jgi:hypothetical protein